MAGQWAGQKQSLAARRGPWEELVPTSLKLSGAYEDSGLQKAGWGWQPAVAPVASLDWLFPGWTQDFLSAQTLATVPCF